MVSRTSLTQLRKQHGAGVGFVAPFFVEGTAVAVGLRLDRAAVPIEFALRQGRGKFSDTGFGDLAPLHSQVR